MRGKGAWICQNLERMGITPAYAGKSPFYAYPKIGQGDHPRVCGEKLVDLGECLGL